LESRKTQKIRKRVGSNAQTGIASSLSCFDGRKKKERNCRELGNGIKEKLKLKRDSEKDELLEDRKRHKVSCAKRREGSNGALRTRSFMRKRLEIRNGGAQGGSGGSKKYGGRK